MPGLESYSALYPAAAERDGLADEEITVLAGEEQREAGVFFRRSQTAEGNLAFQRCLKSFSGLELRRVVDGVLDVVLSNQVDLDVERRDFDPHGLHVTHLGRAGRAVPGDGF